VATRTFETYVEKRLSSREREVPEAVLRLRSEATLLGVLSSTGVTPRLLERGEDREGPWHRVERIMLPTLHQRIDTEGPADAAWIERAVRTSLDALAVLHEASDGDGPLAIVHADLSPTNLALDRDAARAVVLDLDLAWWRSGPERDRAFRGTVRYTAPEVARGERPTTASDLFSLAAVLLYAATGQPPREGPSFAALLGAAAETPLLTEERRTLAARGPAHAVMLRCLEHEPSGRPASARAALALC
jgi:serine/threonine protein kinase